METTESVLGIRREIWSLTKDIAIIEKAKQGVKLADPDEYWCAVLRRVQEAVKPRKKRKAAAAPLSEEHKARYRKAKWEREARLYPDWIKGDSYGTYFLEPDYPDCGTANGLTTFIINYINWTGGNATRVSSEGKAIVKNGEIIRIPSSTRNGTSDVKSTIQGRAVGWEVKAGADRPSPAQIKEQAKERAAGGEYFFTHNVDEFFRQYDGLCVAKTLF